MLVSILLLKHNGGIVSYKFNESSARRHLVWLLFKAHFISYSPDISRVKNTHRGLQIPGFKDWGLRINDS